MHNQTNTSTTTYSGMAGNGVLKTKTELEDIEV